MSLGTACMELLAERIASAFGVDFSGFRRTNLEEAVAGGCSSLLHATDDELLPVVEAALNGETYFLRHEAHFEALRRQVIPALLRARAPARRLRVWSAGCSTGEEALSLAMVLRETVPDPDWQLGVVGTDLSREALRRARRAEYGEWSFRGVPTAVRQRYFVPRGQAFQPAPALASLVEYRRHNLLDGPPDRFDLVVCRNVLIYFREEVLRRAAKILASAVAPGGWLLTGPSEARAELFPELEVHNLGDAIAFHRRGWGAAPALEPEVAPTSLDVKAAVPARRGRARQPRPPEERLRIALARLRTLANRGERDAAWRGVERLLRAHPLAAEAHLFRALLARERGDAAEASRSATAALFLEPSMAMASLLLGDLLRAQGQGPAAVRAYRNALEALEACSVGAEVAGGDGLRAGELAELARRALRQLTPFRSGS